mmetsp:Transcript_25784/g.54903  ORF Transcript_25784/g.54903 Transcript_25784/m.54903 type:complete len:328 (-) Transcript_25784:137-1120(-)
MSPFPDVPLAPAGFLAKIFYIGLLTQMAAVLVTVGIAENSTASPASTTPRGAPTPFSDDPTSLLDLRLGALARRLPALGQRRGDHQFPRYSAVRGLFADHLALWGWAVLGLAAPPLALRLRANCLAPQRPVFVAVQLALGLVALGGALRASHHLRSVRTHLLLRTEHRTVRLAALHLAPVVGLGPQLGAARLARGDGADRLAGLLADRLGAVPQAVGQAAQALVQGDKRGRVGDVLGGILPDGLDGGDGGAAGESVHTDPLARAVKIRPSLLRVDGDPHPHRLLVVHIRPGPSPHVRPLPGVDRVVHVTAQPAAGGHSDQHRSDPHA